MENIMNFFSSLYFGSENVILQIAVISLAFAISLLSAKQIFNYSSNLVNNFYFLRSLQVNIVVKKYIKPAITPLLISITLCIGYFLSDTILGEQSSKLIFFAFQIILIWLFVRMLIIFTGNKFISYFIGIIVLFMLVSNALGMQSQIKDFLDSYNFMLGDVNVSLFNIIKAIFTFVILIWFALLINRFGKSYINQSHIISDSAKIITRGLLKIFVYFVIFLITMKIIGVDLTAFAFLGGAIGVGLGFGLQKIVANFISGIILVFERSIEVGDILELEDGTFGTVKFLGIRNTVITGFDGKEIMIPNENFIIGRVTSWTYSDKAARIDINIGVSYESDLELVKKLLIEAAKEHPKCSANHEPLCFLSAFTNNSVDFLLMFWIDDIMDGRFAPKSDVMLSIWHKFKQHNIIIPFSQMDIHVKNITNDKK